MTQEPFPLDPVELARAIDIPLAEWPGNCHGVACAVRDLVPVEGMRVARGHWHGDVARDSVYRRGTIQHSWLVAPDGRILDPTRWAIVSPGQPFVYLGVSDDYDEGGREMAATVPPPFPGSRDPYLEIVEGMDDGLREELADALGTSSASARSLAESLRFAVRDDPARVPGVQRLYGLLERVGRKAMIPIDSWMLAMDPDALFCRPGANRTFTLPPAPEMGDTELLFEVFNRFLTIEERPDIESELEEFGYALEKDLWGNLNQMEALKSWPIAHLPSRMCDALAVIAGELLGKGFGSEMKVERFAASLGVSPARLDSLLSAFGGRAGYTLGWDVRVADEPPVAEAPAQRF